MYRNDLVIKHVEGQMQAVLALCIVASKLQELAEQ